jgi:hypothetical protein
MRDKKCGMVDVRLQPKIAKAQIYHQPWKGGKNARI